MRQLTRRQRTAALVLAALCLCFITLDLGGGSLAEAHSGVRGVLGGLYRGTDSVLGPARRFLQGLPTAGTNEAKIQSLTAENARLKAQLGARSRAAQVAADVQHLQRAADGGNHVVLPARVLALGPGAGFDWTVTLDVGTGAHVRAGQTVTDGRGLVGRVLHVDADTCVVLLTADRGSGVGVRDDRNGEIGVATGQGVGGYSFAPLRPSADVRVGDHLTTGPSHASSYVAGLSVGTVTAVRRSADGTVRATVRPATSATALDIVGVIVDTPSGLADRVALKPGRR